MSRSFKACFSVVRLQRRTAEAESKVLPTAEDSQLGKVSVSEACSRSQCSLARFPCCHVFVVLVLSGLLVPKSFPAESSAVRYCGRRN